MTPARFTLVTLLFGFLWLFGAPSHAYVENVTHGYPSCIACHASPAGGNLLTDYGRSLSKELMSTWGGWEGSEQPLFGAFKAPKKHLRLGGDFRTMQTYVDNDFTDSGSLFIMQNNIELGLQLEKFTLVTSLGFRGGPEGFTGRGDFISERHYLLWETSPTSRIRAGKFRQIFGISDPNHTRLVKQRLGFGVFTETYNLEFTKFYEKMEVSVNASLGRIDEPRDTRSIDEKNVTLSFSHYLKGKSRVGGTVLLGDSDQRRRWIFGAFGVIPITEKLLTLFELDFQTASPAANPGESTTTFVGQTRLAYKLFKGVLPYAVFEFLSEEQASSDRSTLHRPGLGIQWLPFPHVEIHIEYQRQLVAGSPTADTHFGWLQLHLYPW